MAEGPGPAGRRPGPGARRALGDPVFDLVGPMPYTQVQSYLDDTEPKGRHYHQGHEFLAGLEDGCGSCLPAASVPEADLGLLHLGGPVPPLAPGRGALRPPPSAVSPGRGGVGVDRLPLDQVANTRASPMGPAACRTGRGPGRPGRPACPG